MKHKWTSGHDSANLPWHLTHTMISKIYKVKSHKYYHCHSTTLTSHSGSHALIGAQNMGTLWAVNELTFTTSAGNIIQDDWANTKTKVETDEGHCICWRVPIKDPSHSFQNIIMFTTNLEVCIPAVDTQQ